MLTDYLLLATPRIAVHYTAGEEFYARLAFAAIDQALPAFCQYFEISTPFPQVRIVLVPNRDEFDRLVRDLLRVEIEVPSHPARIAQPQRTDMVVLSPSAYAAHTIFKYVAQDFCRLLVHELVHMLEEFLTPDIETTPRWWSEGLAVYFSEQWRYEDEFRKAALEGLAKQDIPSFAQIEESRKLAYDWGWTIVRFIESAYGREMILRILRECSGGGVFSIVGEKAETLEKRWRAWLLLEKL